MLAAAQGQALELFVPSEVGPAEDAASEDGHFQAAGQAGGDAVSVGRRAGVGRRIGASSSLNRVPELLEITFGQAV